MITLGIDLATEPKNTAACRIDWTTREVVVLHQRLTDDVLVDLITTVDKAAIDVPLGWPDPFVDAVTGHRDNGPWPSTDRNAMSHRTTDRQVRTDTGVNPLSVSADRIGLTAMRGAHLQHLLRARGVAVNRSGTTGPLLETYPAAALRSWGLPHRRYKSTADTDRLHDLIEQVTRQAGFEAVATKLRTHDELDAFVCSLVARAAALDATTHPSSEHHDTARREGWIHLPQLTLAKLAAR